MSVCLYGILYHAMESKAPAKRSQHANTTYRNIVGRNMLCAFGHHVAMCCDVLGVVGSSLKMVKLELKAPAKRSQHGNATLLGATCCVRLATVLRSVATCWLLLAQV